jgi:hypothetical protein
VLDEKSGTVAYEMVSGRVAGAQNGTHSAGVDHMQDGIGDGRTASGYDGTNDYTDVFTAAIAAALNGDTGSVLIWARVSGAGVWTDGTRREALRFIDTDDANEYFWIAKDSNNNQWWFRYSAGGTIDDVRVASGAPLTFVPLLLTWDVNAGASGEVKAYASGAQVGATQVGLGAWVGAIDEATIGAASAVPLSPWSGWLQHCVVWDVTLTDAEAADLNRVE